MRLVICFAVSLALMAGTAIAQQVDQPNQQGEMVTVPKSLLTQEQLDKLPTAGTVGAIQEDQRISYGKEVGIAVGEALNAVSDSAVKFADTRVGTLTILLVAYKVIGRDAIHYLAGAGFTLVWIPLWIWSYRRFLPRRVLIRKTSDAQEWAILNDEPANNSGDPWTPARIALVVHLCIFFVLLIIDSIITFA